MYVLLEQGSITTVTTATEPLFPTRPIYQILGGLEPEHNRPAVFLPNPRHNFRIVILLQSLWQVCFQSKRQYNDDQSQLRRCYGQYARAIL